MFNKNTTEFSSGYFGKLPEFNDFIKFNAGSAEILFIDRWLQDGLAYARLKSKSEWKEKYEYLQPTCFFIPVPSSERIAAGMLYAGKDKSNREFPFLIFSLLSGKYFNELYLIPAELQQIIFTLDELLRKEEDINSLNNALKSYNIVFPEKETLKNRFNQYLLNTHINEFLTRTNLNHSLLKVNNLMYSDSTFIRISFSSDDTHFSSDAGFLIYLVNKKINLSCRHSSIFWSRINDEQFQIIIFPFKITAVNFVDLLSINCNDKRMINLNSLSEDSPEDDKFFETNSSLEKILNFS